MSKRFDFDTWLLEELIEAYHEARKNGKRKTRNEHEFEINEMENLVALRDAIMMRQYKPGRGIAFLIYDPVMRGVFAAPFIDRVVHHFLFKHTNVWWEPRLWRGAYSCRKGKGTKEGVFDLQRNMRRVSRDGKYETVVEKRDIWGCFMSFNHYKLYERVCWGLDRQFPGEGELYRILKYLWKEVIFDVATDGVKVRGSLTEWERLPVSKNLFCQPCWLGLVIGNLTSQLLSNIFLDQLDRFIVYELGYKNFGRYVDDFYFVVRKEDLMKLLEVDMPRIEEFLKEMGLMMHPRKKMTIDIRDGVEFLGAKVYYDHVIPGPRVLENLANKVYRIETTGKGVLEGIGSYDGLMTYYESEKAIRKIFDGVGWDYQNIPSRSGTR